jgi:hypothetical protein
MANAFHNLNANQKSSLALIAIIGLLVLPVTIWSVQKENRSRSKASLTPVSAPITSPITIPSDPCAPNENRIITVNPPGSTGCTNLQQAINAVPDYSPGYQIILNPGYYLIPSSNQLFGLEINRKTDLKFLGHNYYSRHAVKLDFSQNRGGIAVYDSSLLLYNLSLSGNVANGLLNMSNNNNLILDKVILKSPSANALVVSNANSLYINNSKLSSSSVCAYPQNVGHINIYNSHFYRCNTGIYAINSSGTISDNLFEQSLETDIELQDTPNVAVVANTMFDTTTNIDKFALSYFSSRYIKDYLDIRSNNIVSSGSGVLFGPISTPNSSITNNNVYVKRNAYIGTSDPTGINGNTALDPQFGDHEYCLTLSSPLWQTNGNYPGHYGPCGKYLWERDLSNDDKIDILDLNFVYKRFGRPDYDFRSVDLDEDDDVDTIDLHYFRRYLSP